MNKKRAMRDFGRDQVLEQPEQEPVAWIKKDRSAIEVSIMSAEYMTNEGFEPLYTAPCQPKREWVGLTDDEIAEVISGQFAERNYWVKIAKALEAKLKERNT